MCSLLKLILILIMEFLACNFGFIINKKSIIMLLLPRNFKYKKYRKGKNFNKLHYNFTLKQLKFSKIQLISLENYRLTARQLFTIYQILTKDLKKTGFCLFNVFPHTPVTKKPLEIRMGKGKGNVSHYVGKVRIGFKICEVTTNFVKQSLKTLVKVQSKLPILTKILYY